jgi:hypothetical protein
MLNLIPTVRSFGALAAYGKLVINDEEGDFGPPTPVVSWDGLEPHTNYQVKLGITEILNPGSSVTIYRDTDNTCQTASAVGETVLQFNSGSHTTLNLVPSRFASMTLNLVGAPEVVTA